MLAVENQLPSRARVMRWCTQRPSIRSARVGFQVTVTNALLPRASAAPAKTTPAPVPTAALRAHADELGMVPVRAPGAVVEGYVPQLARPHARAVAGPRAHDLRVREPDLAPDDARVRTEHAVVRIPHDAVGVGEAQRRAGPEVAPQAQQVDDRVVAGRERVVVHGPDVGDGGGADLTRQLGTRNRRADSARVNQGVRRVELLQALQKERPLLRAE